MPALTPLRRLAAWRRLPRAQARKAFEAAAPAERWLLYLGCADGALAPLTEKGETGFRRVSAAEREGYRRRLA
jgi:hypothetical protein